MIAQLLMTQRARGGGSIVAVWEAEAEYARAAEADDEVERYEDQRKYALSHLAWVARFACAFEGAGELSNRALAVQQEALWKLNEARGALEHEEDRWTLAFVQPQAANIH
jgi:hypothetical protein